MKGFITMKKILSVLLCVLMILSVLTFASCQKTDGDNQGETSNETTNNETAETLKFGMGVVASIGSVSSADADADGEGAAIVTAAAVLLDAEGKIVECAVDTADNKVNFTAAGVAVEAGEFKTKYELGADYGMVAYGGAAKEWFEQADAFASAVVGKTADEVLAIVADDGTVSDDVLTAGCTIGVTDFVNALYEAIDNAAECSATADAELKIGMVSTQVECKDAAADAEGTNEVDTTIAAAALDADGKVIVMATDAVQAKFTFDIAGAPTVEAGALTTKKEKGADYGMVAYGGAAKEWFEQAEVFNSQCEGKTANEISAFVLDTGYGVDALQSAGCTIGVSDMVKAAVKAATVA